MSERNAADPRQVRQAAKDEQRARALKLLDWRAVLRTPEGRRVLYGIIEELRPCERLWEPSGLLNYKVALHDAGVKLVKQIEDAEPKAWIRMQMEAVQETEPKNDAEEEKEDE